MNQRFRHPERSPELFRAKSKGSLYRFTGSIEEVSLRGEKMSDYVPTKSSRDCAQTDAFINSYLEFTLI